MNNTVLLIASFPDSLIKFRGPLIDALLARRLEVHVAVPNLAEGDAIHQALTGKGVSVHVIGLQRTGVNPVADLSTILELYRLMIKIKPRFVLGYTIKPVVYGSLAAWLARVPRRFALITGLGYAFTGQAGGKRGLLKTLIQRLYRFALGRVDKVFFQNPDDEELFRKLGILSAKVASRIVNGSGVDVAEYQQVLLPKSPHFLLIARLLGDKGVREYVQAAVQVKIIYPQAQFQLVGWIDDNPDAIKRQELDDWVAAGTVEYLGKLDDVRPAIAGCGVYVLPSYREGTPRTVLEAMAMGRAVITTDAPGCRETVIDGLNGYLVSVKSVAALVDVMQKFIENPELVAEMGAESRRIAEEKYDVHKVNAHMLSEMGIE
ncbi:glycosyltransferase family 4 protein [Desulfotalea psychrophila]|uniref:Related to glycosyl transferase (WbpU) n=1 Tax=Desulfotalea psychrophila (strain LSv54 / DSM 12343) TaxID=177439 RepID=Q6ASA3_DESPS|nr:glycosyltransferase family 4 protein [Desulfotalea psychrophila]CAG34760.1 related to glycosyl transferase (WbpU) [Desulfotalea psychrophila LSv54]